MVQEQSSLASIRKIPLRWISCVFFWGWLVSSVGCASTAPASRIIYQDPNRLVRLEVIYRPEGKGHDHPVTIHGTDIAAIMRELTVSPRPVQPLRGPFAYEKGRESGEASKLFSDDNINFLSQHLAQALERSTPAEDVMFFINHSESREPSEITSGSVFVEGKELHLLFANYRHRTVGTSEIQKAQANPLEVLGSPMYDLTPGPFGKIQKSKGLKVFVTGAPQHLVIDYASLLKTQGMAQNHDTLSSEDKFSPNQSLEGKLQELNELRQKGLITEEEHQNLRLKVLKSF